jgi:hypothetical protein
VTRTFIAAPRGNELKKEFVRTRFYPIAGGGGTVNVRFAVPYSGFRRTLERQISVDSAFCGMGRLPARERSEEVADVIQRFEMPDLLQQFIAARRADNGFTVRPEFGFQIGI